MPQLPRATGIAPSMVDVSAKLPGPAFEKCLDILDVQPGDWVGIDSDQADQLLVVITGTQATGVEALRADPDVSVVAGSSILGMLTAMPPSIRRVSSLVSTLAHKGGRIDPMASIFSAGVRAAGLHHEGHPTEGKSPLGFVLSSVDSAEKVLAMHPGVAGDLDQSSLDEGGQSGRLILVDAYELRGGRIGAYIERLIASGEHEIALSLGNRKILDDALRTRIRGHIARGELKVVCGNEEELAALYPELPTDMTSVDGFRAHPIRDAVPYVLLTRDERGLSASWEGAVVDIPAHPVHPDRIVNTSGAGDTSAGVFYGGVLAGTPARETLEKAALSATRVLQIPGSSIIADS